MAKGYIIGHLNVKDMAAFGAGYAMKVPAVISEFGGAFLVKGGNVPYCEGDKADIDVIVEFPDLASAEAFLASDAYKEIESVRKEHTTGPFMIVEGV
jgi:uncharacterized protein (DUF1330 family)